MIRDSNDLSAGLKVLTSKLAALFSQRKDLVKLLNLIAGTLIYHILF